MANGSIKPGKRAAQGKSMTNIKVSFRTDREGTTGKRREAQARWQLLYKGQSPGTSEAINQTAEVKKNQRRSLKGRKRRKLTRNILSTLDSKEEQRQQNFKMTHGNLSPNELLYQTAGFITCLSPTPPLHVTITTLFFFRQPPHLCGGLNKSDSTPRFQGLSCDPDQANKGARFPGMGTWFTHTNHNRWALFPGLMMGPLGGKSSLFPWGTLICEESCEDTRLWKTEPNRKVAPKNGEGNF